MVMFKEGIMKRILNIEYASLQALYWMNYAVIGSFASVYLLGKDYSNSEIGIIVALGNVLAVVLQPLIGDIADRTKKISLISIIQMVTVLLIALMSLLFAFENKNVALSITFVLLSGWLPVIQPLLNSLIFKIEQSGVDINFGIARSMGSLGYAILSVMLGGIVESIGIEVVPITGEIVLLMFLGSLMLTAYHKNKVDQNNSYADDKDIKLNHEAENKSYDSIGLVEFAKRNKWFMLVSLASIGAWYSNAVFNSFMLQVITPIGGSSEDMGIIFGVMAGLEIPVLIFFDKLKSKISCQNLAKIGAVGFFLKILSCMLAPTIKWFIVGHLFQMIAFALFLPSMVHFINEVMSEGEAVKGQSVFTTMMTLGVVFAALTGGIILDYFGASTLMLMGTIASGVGAIIIIASIGKIKSHKHEPMPE